MDLRSATKQPEVFVSYSAKDAAAAKKLTSDLYGHGFQVWDPQAKIRPGEPWAAELMKALERADTVLVLISPHTEASNWQSSEIAFALAKAQENAGKRIIPILLDRSASLPFFLRTLHGLDLSDPDTYQNNLPRLLNALSADRPVPLAFDGRAYKDLLDSQMEVLGAERRAAQSSYRKS